MPYDPKDTKSLPENVQGLDNKKQRQWTHIFNKTLEKHGDESKAFTYANGVLKREQENKGFWDDDNPDRDVLLELEAIAESEEETLEEKIAKDLGLEIEVKESTTEISPEE